MDTNSSKPPAWELNMTFSWYDHALFSSMLILSAGIGVYFGCFGNKQSTATEYLHGGKIMKVFPIGVSLVASHVSGVSLLALPTDIYTFGATYWLIIISIAIVCLLTSYVFLPVFYKLQITSTFEYLQMRFDSRTRLCASFIFTVDVLLYLPIVIYIPALAFSQGTGMPVHYVAGLVCGICIFYTTIGGLKAVVWTDTIQFIITVVSSLIILFVGLSNAGGLRDVFAVAADGHRLDIDFAVDPLKRDTFWTMVIGFTAYYISHVATNQGSVQKLLSLPTIGDAHKAIILFGFGVVGIKTCSVLMGLIMYHKYQGCDPMSAGVIKARDQMVPYYVMDVVGYIPGLPGIFIAGVFCTALSTLSANLNSLSGSIYEDFVSRHMPENVSQKTVSNVLKIIVVIVGVVSTSAVFLVQRLGGLLPLAISFSSISSSNLLGLFTLGAIFPRVNAKGAFYGSLTSFVFMCWLIGGIQYYKAQGYLSYPTKPMSTEYCEFNVAQRNTTIPSSDDIFYLFRISHYYLSLVGIIVCVLVAIAISWMTNENDPPVNKDLISPVVHFLLKDEPLSNECTPLNKLVDVIESTDVK